MKYCKHCNKALEDDAAFCTACGKPQKEEQKSISSCPICGKELDNTESFCPICGAPVAATSKTVSKPVSKPTARPAYVPVEEPKKKKTIFKRWWFWLIVAFVVFIALPSGSDEPEIVGDEGGNGVVQNDTAPTYITIGQTADWDNIRVTFNNATQNNGNEWIAPSQGNVFIICDFTIENNTSSELNISSLLCFDAYADDYSTSTSFSAETSVEKDTLDGTIAPGKKMNGIVGYEIPSDWETLEIHFTPDFWSGKDFIFACTNN